MFFPTSFRFEYMATCIDGRESTTSIASETDLTKLWFLTYVHGILQSS